MPNNLDKKIFKKFDQIAKKEEKNILHSAIFKNGVQKIAFKNESLIDMQHLFSEDIKTGKITSQNSSGRCWLFAAVNVLREQTAKKLKIEDFELSQTYLMFYDKLEKANYF
ncbi:MAG: aminopeptidase, partial [Candidatus Delongbacteria bacterium]|nr:aminopeptidase [Candidatus Delongbacteria bacterium]